MIYLVDPRRLELLLELSRLGSMREVGEAMQVTTSTVSQQIAALARESGTPLIEPDGRRVRLTPAGRRLAGHAVTILAAIEAARRDLDPEAPPAGTVRVAAYASAFRQVLLPVARMLAGRQPEVRLHLLEQEPAEALGLLAADEVDLALTYDYNLAPVGFGRDLQAEPLASTPWHLGTPSGPGPRGTAVSFAGTGTTRGSSTHATPPTRTWCASWPRWPASSRGSRSARTAWTWCMT
jgi:DNA-binding transcriptional LysR family regulator